MSIELKVILQAIFMLGFFIAIVALIYSNIQLRKAIKLLRPQKPETVSPRIAEMRQIVKEMQEVVGVKDIHYDD